MPKGFDRVKWPSGLNKTNASFGYKEGNRLWRVSVEILFSGKCKNPDHPEKCPHARQGGNKGGQIAIGGTCTAWGGSDQLIRKGPLEAGSDLGGRLVNAVLDVPPSHSSLNFLLINQPDGELGCKMCGVKFCKISPRIKSAREK